MDVLPVQGGHELGQGVQTAFLRAPVEPVAPMGRQALHEDEVRAVLPGRRQRGSGPPGGRQPIVKIAKVGVRYVDLEGLDHHIGTPWRRDHAVMPDHSRRGLDRTRLVRKTRCPAS